MAETMRIYTRKIGIPRLIISVFFVMLWIVAFAVDLPILTLVSDLLRRFGMNGILVLAMVPAIHSGIGLNFGLPLGIICGVLGALISIQFGMVGFVGLFVAIAVAIPLAMIVGWLYGLMLNKIKGSEMLVSTYVGFSFVFLMSIGWIVLPFNHPEMRWPIGQGLRVTIALESTFGYVLNNLGMIRLGKLVIPTGLLLFFAAVALLLGIFLKSKHGIAMKASGDNPKFATASGLNVDGYRVLGTVLSTVLAAVGMIAYAQSYGYVQLYQAPLMMAFPAAAAILIGGATAKKAKISHVIIGIILFQGLLTIALPVASTIFDKGNISEVLRMIVQNGIILYALTKVGGGE